MERNQPGRIIQGEGLRHKSRGRNRIISGAGYWGQYFTTIEGSEGRKIVVKYLCKIVNILKEFKKPFIFVLRPSNLKKVHRYNPHRDMRL